MSTPRQIEANRRNAQKSTGPTSVTGKAASSMNALKTGIHAKSLLLKTEKLDDLEQLIEEYYQHHQPALPRLSHEHPEPSPPVSNHLQQIAPESPKSLLYLQSRTAVLRAAYVYTSSD